MDLYDINSCNISDISNNLFDARLSHDLRAYLIKHAHEYSPGTPIGKAAVAVVNAADKCHLSCPNCLFSAPVVSRVFDGNPPAITQMQAYNFVRLMNEANLNQLVFSGGGESYENLECMTYFLENLVTIRQVVTITSAYFAENMQATKRIFEILIQAIEKGNHKRGIDQLDFILRLSFDNSHNVSLDNIVNVLHFALTHNSQSVKFRPIIRTLLDDGKNRDTELAKALGAQLLLNNGNNDTKKFIDGIPIIDGFPVNWLILDENQIPIIYKPLYFEGSAIKKQSSSQTLWSWRDIKQQEENADTPFNLAVRGLNGEGHNYYETVLKGYDFWKHDLGGVMRYVTPKKQSEKGLGIYLPADGRLFVNATSPDSYVPVESVSSWHDFLRITFQDILQFTVITQPTNFLLDLVEEVHPNLYEIIARRNFVFSVAYTCMETPQLRLYLTLKLLKIFAEEMNINYENELVHTLVSIDSKDLQSMFKEHYNKCLNIYSGNSTENGKFRDPIIGDQKSVHIQ